MMTLDAEPQPDERSGATVVREGFELLLGLLGDAETSDTDAFALLRTKLVHFFGWRGVSDPDDLADETLERVARKLGGGERLHTASPQGYCLAVARFVLKEHFRAAGRRQQSLSELAEQTPSASHPQDAEPSDARQALLRAQLDELGDDQRRLILSYYQGERSEKIRNRRALAAELGVPMNALRIRVCRIRSKLAADMQKAIRAEAH